MERDRQNVTKPRWRLVVVLGTYYFICSRDFCTTSQAEDLRSRLRKKASSQISQGGQQFSSGVLLAKEPQNLDALLTDATPIDQVAVCSFGSQVQNLRYFVSVKIIEQNGGEEAF